MKKRFFLILSLFFQILFNFTVYGKGKLDYNSVAEKVKENPTNTFYLSKLANHYEKIKEYKEAVKLYKKCLDIEPENSLYYIELAKSYDHIDRPDLGLSVMSNAVKYFDKNDDVFSAFASLEYKMGDFKSSLEAYEKALHFSDEKSKHYIFSGIAKVYRELKDYDKSKIYFQKALQEKQDCWTYYEYGKLFYEIGEYQQSICAFQKSSALLGCTGYNQDKEAEELINKKIAEAYYAYGIKLKDSGRKEEAKKILTKIVEDKSFQKTAVCEKAEFWIKRI